MISRSKEIRGLIYLIPAILLLVAFFVLPLFDLLEASFRATKSGDASATLSNYVNILGDSFFRGALINSLGVGLATTVVCLALSYPVAFYLSKTDGWERTLISVACLLPLFINIIVGILGWYILLTPFGVVQQALEWLGLVSGPLRWLRTFGAMVVVLTYEHVPFAILILASTLQNVPADKINAARILGASNLTILRTILIPLTAPGLVACFVLVFALSTSSYLIPILIAGPQTSVFPVMIFTLATELFDREKAAAMAALLFASVAAITYSIAALANRMSRRGKWEMV